HIPEYPRIWRSLPHNGWLLMPLGSIMTLLMALSLLYPPAGVPPSGVSVSAQPPGGQVALGDSLVLSCAVATGTGPLSFSWHWEGSGAPLGTGPRLELRHAGDNDSGQYRCRWPQASVGPFCSCSCSWVSLWPGTGGTVWVGDNGGMGGPMEL
uniref:Uncharacterized protein n=1 Tax=Geospiza parvula TaxID=87175 RepID=A0A8C3MIC7_GEOPR